MWKIRTARYAYGEKIIPDRRRSATNLRRWQVGTLDVRES